MYRDQQVLERTPLSHHRLAHFPPETRTENSSHVSQQPTFCNTFPCYVFLAFWEREKSRAPHCSILYFFSSFAWFYYFIMPEDFASVCWCLVCKDNFVIIWAFPLRESYFEFYNSFWGGFLPSIWESPQNEALGLCFYFSPYLFISNTGLMVFIITLELGSYFSE